MAQFQVQVESVVQTAYDKTDRQQVMVWADNAREAGLRAIKVARKLTRYPHWIVVSATDESLGKRKARVKQHAITKEDRRHGEVRTRTVDPGFIMAP